MQSIGLRVAAAMPLTTANQPAAAIASPGWLATAYTMQAVAEAAVSRPKGTSQNCSLTTYRIRNPRTNSSSMIGTITASPSQRTPRKAQAHGESGPKCSGRNGL